MVEVKALFRPLESLHTKLVQLCLYKAGLVYVGKVMNRKDLPHDVVLTVAFPGNTQTQSFGEVSTYIWPYRVYLKEME